MSPARMDKIESAIRLVADFRAAFDRHDPGALAALLSEDCVFEEAEPAPDGARLLGRDAVRAGLERAFATMPGLRMEIEELSGFGSRCLARWRLEWEGPGGEARHLRGLDLWREKGGLLVERLSYRKGD